MARKVITTKTKQRTFAQELPVRLTHEEYERTAEKLAVKIAEVDALSSKKKAATKDFTDRIMIASREQETLRKAVETHTEDRMVECTEEADFERNRLIVRRTDTNEIVSERAMDGDERARLAQGELPVDELGNHDEAHP